MVTSSLRAAANPSPSPLLLQPGRTPQHAHRAACSLLQLFSLGPEGEVSEQEASRQEGGVQEEGRGQQLGRGRRRQVRTQIFLASHFSHSKLFTN